MNLPPRVFYTLSEAAAHWNCAVAGIAGWAAAGKLRIMTGIGLVRCGDIVVAGQVCELCPVLSISRFSGHRHADRGSGRPASSAADTGSYNLARPNPGSPSSTGWQPCQLSAATAA